MSKKSKFKVSRLLAFKCLLDNKAYNMVMILIVSICFCFMTVYSIVVYSSFSNDIRKVANTYGSYTFLMKNPSESQLKIINNEKNVQNCLRTVTESAYINNESATILYVDNEDFLNVSGNKLIDGVFPKRGNEIAVEKWFLIQQGIPIEKMVGSKIIVSNSLMNKEIEYVVTGVLNINERLSEMFDKVPLAITTGAYDKSNDLESLSYIMTSNPDKAYSDIDMLLKKLSIKENDNSFITNYELADSYKIVNTSSWKSITERMVDMFLFIVIILFFMISLNNVINGCLMKWNNVINIQKILGVSVCKLKLTIWTLLSVTIIIGSALGALFGGIISYFFVKLSFVLANSTVKNSIYIPYIFIALMMVIMFICSSLLLLSKIKYIGRLTSQEMHDTSHSNIDDNKEWKTRKTILYNKHFNIIRNTLRNVSINSTYKIITILMMAGSIVLLIIFSIKLDKVSLSKDNNDDYQYRIEFDYVGYDEEDKSEYYQQLSANEDLKSYCDKNNIVLFCYESERTNDVVFRIKKSDINDEFRHFISTDLELETQMKNSREYITIYADIMGYTPNMLRKLYQMENRKYRPLGENEIIALNRISNLDNNLEISADFLKDSQTYNEDESSNPLVVVDCVDNLPLYSKTKKSLCVIMDYDAYVRKYEDSRYFCDYYINKISKEQIKEISCILEGIESIRIINQEEELNEVKANNYQSIITYISIFILITMCSMVNMVLMNLYDINIRKFEFAMQKAIGISSKYQKCICLCEIIFVYGMGLIIGFLISYGILKRMYDSNIIYKINIPLYIVYVIIAFSVLYVFSCYITISKKINAIKIPEDLS